ncbi:NUMOD4 motif-containing HNH endonuclease [Sphingobium lactosutens]|uniref:NUMOD4 motif-containing HNH endonuclease n=1 Tax=Sphingobium lactosutens TaxID=522773 RepID=UPI003A4C77AE|nr:NUMOD4 motif-containing HNH endonuclease [Sphingobium lactosutens]
MLEEVWKSIPGLEGYYEASNLGRIRSLSRYVAGGGEHTGGRYLRRSSSKILSPAPDSKGYLIFKSSVEGRKSRQAVHRCVCAAFHGAMPQGMTDCRHKDGNKLNNREENLAWSTRSDNLLDRNSHGTDTRGVKSPSAKLSESQVYEIREMFDRGLSIDKITDHFPVSYSQIYAVAKRIQWKHLAEKDVSQ